MEGGIKNTDKRKTGGKNKWKKFPGNQSIAFRAQRIVCMRHSMTNDRANRCVEPDMKWMKNSFPTQDVGARLAEKQKGNPVHVDLLVRGKVKVLTGSFCSVSKQEKKTHIHTKKMKQTMPIRAKSDTILNSGFGKLVARLNARIRTNGRTEACATRMLKTGSCLSDSAPCRPVRRLFTRHKPQPLALRIARLHETIHQSHHRIGVSANSTGGIVTKTKRPRGWGKEG